MHNRRREGDEDKRLHKEQKDGRSAVPHNNRNYLSLGQDSDHALLPERRLAAFLIKQAIQEAVAVLPSQEKASKSAVNTRRQQKFAAIGFLEDSGGMLSWWINVLDVSPEPFLVRAKAIAAQARKDAM